VTDLRREKPAEAGEAELRRIERELVDALGEIRYGSIEIVIHDARVIQIERRERIRFDRAEDRDPR
jgi:hypothetical protein